jgi:anti-sigma factor RsiW
MPEGDIIENEGLATSCAGLDPDTVHAYLDGELSIGEQPALFEHLAGCRECRRTMDSVLAFRRMSRQEYLALPPSADEAFFERLARFKKLSDQHDRGEDRQPLWNARRSISLRSAVFLAAVVFFIGLVLPMPARTEYATAMIQMEVERVQFEPSDSVVLVSHLYHILDGPTVEADRADVLTGSIPNADRPEIKAEDADAPVSGGR